MQNKIAHLEMIQNVINRMSVNSFLLKGWSVVVVSSLVAWLDEPEFALAPLALFWALDAYFLHQERRFRDLYNEVRKLPEAEIDFAMDYVSREYGAVCVVRWTVLLFHGALLAVVLLVIFN